MKYKRFILSFVLSVMLAFVFVISACAKTVGVVSSSDGSATLRSGAGTSYDKVTTLYNGIEVEILETVNCTDNTTKKQWYRVTCTVDGVTYNGYINVGMIGSTTYVKQSLTTEVPEEYKSYVAAMKSAHPNWEFKFLETGIEWSDAVQGETQKGVSAISGSFPISYRSTSVNFTKGTTLEGYVRGDYLKIDSSGTKATVISNNDLNVRSGVGTNYQKLGSIPSGSVIDCYGKAGTDSSGYPWYKISYTGYTYKAIEGSSWFQAHGQVVQYYLDPRNFINESNIFMFEQLSFDEDVHTVSGVSAILSSAKWAQGNITTDDGRSVSYAQAFYEAGKKYNVSPYHLAARALQEVGADGTEAAYGTNAEYSGIYNFYSIGANTGATDGLKWASNDNGYGTPWNTPYKSIAGGAEFIANGYINQGQSTLYLQKFDLISSGGLYNHQYMTNVSAAESESVTVKRSYVSANALDSNFVFVIPIFKNMPITSCRLPAKANTPNYAKDTDVANLFPDVASSEWYYKAVAFNVEKNYFNGYANGYFGPADNMQRQDFIINLAKIAKADLTAYQGVDCGLSDVSTDAYYTSAVAWAVENDIIGGYQDGRFGVSDSITREQICVILYKYMANYLGEDVSLSEDTQTILSKFSDKDNISTWAVTSVAWAVENGIVGGGAQTSVNPLGNATRAEVAQIFMNMSNNDLI